MTREKRQAMATSNDTKEEKENNDKKPQSNDEDKKGNVKVRSQPLMGEVDDTYGGNFSFISCLFQDDI